MVVILLGILMELREEQLSYAYSPMVVTESGKDIDSSEVQF